MHQAAAPPNLRAWKESGGHRTYYRYDGLALLAEVSAAGTVTAYNTWGPTGLLARTTPPTKAERWYVFDPTGSVALRLAGGEPGDPVGYKGQSGYYTDAETGLILCTWRYYDPSAGRWLTEDPIGYAGGMNVYGYCGGRPAFQVDPSGLDSYVPCCPDDANGKKGFTAWAEIEASRSAREHGIAHMVAIRTEAEFVAAWNGMAVTRSDAITLMFHGSPHTITIDADIGEYLTTMADGRTPGTGTPESRIPATRIDDLVHRDVAELNIVACNTAHVDHMDDNVLMAFHRTGHYGLVTGWDGSVAYGRFTGAPILSRKQETFPKCLPPGSKRTTPYGRVMVWKGGRTAISQPLGLFGL